MEADFQAGRDDRAYILELAEEMGFAFDGDGSDDKFLLVDAGTEGRFDFGEDVAREERFGETLRLRAIAADTIDQGEVVLEVFSFEQRGEFLFATRFGVADVPARDVWIDRGRHFNKREGLRGRSQPVRAG